MRVIAGAFGGRTLVAPAGLATRPTTDRVREALFSILGPLDEARVLDLYAGTGALGIEALSRGAAHATFVEGSRAAIVALKKNLAALGLDARATVIADRVERAVAHLAASREPFDLVFADPPYDDAARAAEILARLRPALAAGARLVLEHRSRRAPPLPPPLRATGARTYGDTGLVFLAAEGD